MKMATALRCALGGILAALLAVATANAQEWPKAKPITFVVPFAAGTDVVPRLLAVELEKILGQKVIVENRPGAGGANGTAYVARQPADGYTIVMTAPGPGANYLNSIPTLSYNPLKDFEHISLIASGDCALMVGKDFPANNLQEFIAYVKANPDKINIGNNGTGTLVHMVALVMADRYELKVKHIPYRGSGEIATDLLSGSIQAASDYLGNQHVAQVTAGKFKVLATGSDDRSALVPNVPTLKEQGFDFSAPIWVGVLAPKGTPRPIVEKLNAAIREGVKAPDYVAKVTANAQRAISSTPEEFRKVAFDEEAKWRDVIKKYNLVSQ